MSISVSSEVLPLKKVLVHRPGSELENLTPDELETLLFDDIPYLEKAIEEHEAFTRILRENGVEVVYLEDLIAEVLEDDGVKQKFIKQFLKEAHVEEVQLSDELYRIKDNKELVLKTMQGIRNTTNQGSSFLVYPMPNLYFTRDPFATIGTGVSMNHMAYPIRNRESIYGEYIFNYHPLYKDTPQVYHRDSPYHIEGGDILNLTETLIMVGISERTELSAVLELAQHIFSDSRGSVTTILAVTIPKKRAFMHLDTIFTQVDLDKFLIHPIIKDQLQVSVIEQFDGDSIKVTPKAQSLQEVLTSYFGYPITYILCGGDDEVDSAREQWNDGANALCIKPGEVIVYDRNPITNKLLRQNGIKVHEIPSSELSRGRGGPRCMSMPLVRESNE